MTAHRDLKRIIRDRQKKTGESYSAARAHVMRERAALLGRDSNTRELVAKLEPGERQRADAVVLKVNQSSARVRVLGEDGELTFRSSDVWTIAPGHLVTLSIDKRWSWRGDAYASGALENPRIAIEALGLDALPLEGGHECDLRIGREPFESPDPYAPLWEELTARPRRVFEMDPIAWGALPGLDDDENPTCDAAELAAAGERGAARELLMEVLGTDLRCIDAHAHLANLEFERSPARAIVHYEIGKRIAELSLPANFDGVLEWAQLYNRPYLRCLHGFGVCLWRLGELDQAAAVFEQMLRLDPNDGIGVRFCWQDVRDRRTWDEAAAE